MNLPTPFIGVGTGRCGTTSLANIVDSCENTVVTHETYVIPWYESGHPELGRLIRDMKGSTDRGILHGAVSQCYLNCIGEIRSAFPGLGVVCMHRDKQGMTDSFVAYNCNKLRPSDKQGWVNRQMGNTIKARSQLCWPLIDAASPRQAFEFYWEMYEAMMRSILDPVFHMDMDDLNNDDRLSDLFDFLMIPQKDRRFSGKRKWWSLQEVNEKRKILASETRC